ncbi:MAG: DUF5666 domain-containing protein [Gemmatimonadaceae bacterium]
MISRPGLTPFTLGVAAFGMLGTACSQRADTSASDTSSSAAASTATADTSAMVRGTVTSASPTQVVVATPAGNVTVAVTRPLQVYSRQPATLADVKDNVFIGVTTVKQPDGSERATEIHIFPEELRGLGEGSRMMNAGAGGNPGNRMTNGAVAESRMTNGTASSRMSNGNVTNASGSTLEVQYPGGSQKVTVPPNTPVTQLKAISKQLAAGDRVAIQAKKNADGSLSTNRVMLAGK